MIVNKKKTAIAASCVAASLILAFGAAPLYNHIFNKSVMVVRANTKITQNEKITSDMLETVSVSAKNLPAGTYSDTSKVVGEYATTDISAHDDVTKSKLSSKSATLPDGQMLITIPVKTVAAGLNGNIQPGDIVSLYGVNGNSGTTAAETLQDLEYVRVYSSSVVSASDSDGNTNNMTLTLYVDKQQAADLAGWDNQTLHIALASRDDTEKAEELLQEQTDSLSPESNSHSSTAANVTKSSSTSASKKTSSSSSSASASSVSTSSNTASAGAAKTSATSVN